jgi:hypothetical protein
MGQSEEERIEGIGSRLYAMELRIAGVVLMVARDSLYSLGLCLFIGGIAIEQLPKLRKAALARWSKVKGKSSAK